MTFRIIRQSACSVTPWKNGQGWSAELAIYPDGATVQDFGWRISRAGTDRDAPFSRFPGVDRTLLLLTGSVNLKVGEESEVLLTPASGPFRFRGETPIQATLKSAALTDFNVMTRRDLFAHTVECRTVEGRIDLPRHDHEIVLIYLLHGSLKIGKETVETGDAVLFAKASSENMEILAQEPCEIVLVRILRCRGGL